MGQNPQGEIVSFVGTQYLFYMKGLAQILEQQEITSGHKLLDLLLKDFEMIKTTDKQSGGHDTEENVDSLIDREVRELYLDYSHKEKDIVISEPLANEFFKYFPVSSFALEEIVISWYKKKYGYKAKYVYII